MFNAGDTVMHPTEGVCRVEDPTEGYFVFEVNFAAQKTSIDASPLLCRLRSQLKVGNA